MKVWKVFDADGIHGVEQDGVVKYEFGPEAEDRRHARELAEMLNRFEVYRCG